MKYCCWILALLCLLCGEPTARAETGSNAALPLRFGVTPAFARSQYALLEQWRDYLEQRLHRPVELVFRDNQQECLGLLKQKKLDFAWISAPAYLQHPVRLLVTPLYQGRPYERAYLIVPATDQQTHRLADLKGKLFAYVDMESNTGHLEPRYQLQQQGIAPEHFFKASFFTHDHLKVVAAVAIGLADAGSLSGVAWETLAHTRPEITAQTRIVRRSAEYGLPPIVARRTLASDEASAMQRILLDMAQDPAGKALLRQFNLDGFSPAHDRLYRNVEQMMREMGER